MATNTKHKQSSLEQELTAKTDELANKRKEMLKHGLKYTFNDIINSIESHQDEFTKLMIGRILKNDIMDLTAKLFVEATKGRVIVPHYSPSVEKASPVWVYVGTHWAEIPDPQITRDYIRKACEKMELDERFINDNTFFDKLRKKLEHILSSYPEEADREDMVLVNFLNGTLEISHDGTPYLRPHRREDYFRYVLHYEYNKEACCPKFLKFLDDVLPNKGVQKTVLEYIAYCLIPRMRIEKILALLGGGSNGKSVLIRIIEGLFGKDAVTHESLHDLSTNETHRANIEKKIANLSSENEGYINDAVFRTLASGEPVSCRKYYSQPYEMDQYAKLIFAFNQMPKVKSLLANKRRWLLINFDVTISEEEADVELGEKLLAELPGIANLVLSQLPELLQRKKFSKCDAVENAVKELEFYNDTVLQFIKTRCKTGPSISTKGSELYKDFKEYCIENEKPKMSNQDFYRRLRELHHDIPDDGHQPTFNIKVVRYED